MEDSSNRPSHFTDVQLDKVIKQACGIDASGREPVDFIWLDLACIDQRRNLSADLEVGRQAGIFRKAAGVVVWLSQSGKDENSFCLLRDFFKVLAGFENDRQKSLKVISDCSQLELFVTRLRKLLVDPWFSSLWTLQEAYLSTTAFCSLRRQKNYVRSKTACSHSTLWLESVASYLCNAVTDLRSDARISNSTALLASLRHWHCRAGFRQWGKMTPYLPCSLRHASARQA